MVGCFVGSAIGDGDGAGIGDAVGAGMGSTVGAGMGVAVGAGIRIAVAAVKPTAKTLPTRFLRRGRGSVVEGSSEGTEL